MRSSVKPIFLCACFLLAAGLLVRAQDEKPKDAGKAKSSEKAADSEKKEKGAEKKKDKDKDKKKGKDKGKMKPGEGKETGEAEPNEGRLSLPLVKDHPSKGLKIPYYDTAGNLQMIFVIGTATRLDNDHVKMEETQVETYNEEGEAEMTVNLPASVLDLNTKVVSSQTKTTIKREDFVITGDNVEFNTVTKQGTLVGNVHMTINNLNEEVPSQTLEPPREQ